MKSKIHEYNNLKTITMSKKTVHTSLKMIMLTAFLISGKAIAQRGPSSTFIPNPMKPEVVIEKEKIEKEQKRIPTKIGFGLETYVTGNAHGAFYSAGINISKGKALFSIAPCLQKRSKELNGGKIAFS